MCAETPRRNSFALLALPIILHEHLLHCFEHWLFASTIAGAVATLFEILIRSENRSNHCYTVSNTHQSHRQSLDPLLHRSEHSSIAWTIARFSATIFRILVIRADNRSTRCYIVWNIGHSCRQSLDSLLHRSEYSSFASTIDQFTRLRYFRYLASIQK